MMAITSEIIPMDVSVPQNPIRLVDERWFGRRFAKPACIKIKTESDNAIHDADDSRGI
jgi:hypothetical protein